MPENKALIIQNILTQLEHRVRHSSLSIPTQEDCLHLIEAVDTSLIVSLCNRSTHTLTYTNLQYLCCFLAGIDTLRIAAIFLIEPSTVYTVRYRLRSYFTTEQILPF